MSTLGAILFAIALPLSLYFLVPKKERELMDRQARFRFDGSFSSNRMTFGDYVIVAGILFVLWMIGQVL